MDGARIDKLDDLFCEFVARLVCVRPTLYVKTGDLLSLVDDDPPVRNERSLKCHSCNSAMRNAERGRLLCSTCRARPTAVFQGAPLIDTMYRSAHPKYVLSPKMEAIVEDIGKQRQVASQAHAMAKRLAYLSYQVYERWKVGKGDMNVYFARDCVHSTGSYAQALTNSNPRYVDDEAAASDPPAKGGWDVRLRHLAVTVGGLGPKLQHVVKQSVMEWLYNLDAMIRKRFGIDLSHGQGGASMIVNVIEHFAELVANRVVLLEERVENPTEHLCSVAFEHIAEMEFLRCTHDAGVLARADVRSMRELVKLAQEQEVPDICQPLVSFLRSPCPELVKALPSVAQDMQFGELADALCQPSGVARKIKEWCASVAVESLCMLLKRAIELTQKWRPAFLKCVRYDEAPLKEHLPPHGWVDDPRIASWSLVSSAAHAHRRTGLDSPGLRIVLMSSALMQINGDGRFFRPGAVRCDIMSPAANNHEYLSSHAYNALSEQMWPYMTGAPWKFVKNEMVKWQGSHIEEDVRRAASLLGGFSVNEIVARYTRSALHVGLMRSTVQKMVYKPATQYEQWFPMAVDLLIPILGQLRRTMGIEDAVSTSPVGDVLRLMPSVRDWKPGDGALQLTTGEAYDVPCVKTMLVRLQAEGSLLVKKKRVGTHMCWVLDPLSLAKVLGK